MLTVVVIFLFISLGAALALASIVYRESAVVRNSTHSIQSIYASESLQEDLLFRLMSGKKTATLEPLSLNGAEASAVIEDEPNQKRIVSMGDAEDRIRKTEMIVNRGSGAVFFGGVQTGQGGFSMSGSSKLIGNVYSNGPIVGGWSTSITGDAVSAGPSGMVKGFQGGGVAGSVHASRIEGVKVGGDAHYKTITGGATVGGTSYPGSPDQPPLELPLAEDQIELWKSEAEAGGVHTSPCSYNIGGVAKVTLGNIKINCNLSIGNSSEVTLTGPIWVAGNLDISGSAKVFIDPELEGVSVPIVVDNPSNRTSGSHAAIRNSAEVSGAGDGSYVVVISRNNSAENGGSTTAINLLGSGRSNDILLYAAGGKIHIGGSAELTSTTGYLVEMIGSSSVRYDYGVASPVFNSGSPGGTYQLRSLREVQ